MAAKVAGGGKRIDETQESKNEGASGKMNRLENPYCFGLYVNNTVGQNSVSTSTFIRSVPPHRSNYIFLHDRIFAVKAADTTCLASLWTGNVTKPLTRAVI